MDRSSAEQNLKPIAITQRTLFALSSLLSLFLAGCYAPLHSPGIAASTLPDEFRWPMRTSAPPLNYSNLVGPTPSIYLLGPGDKLQITAPDLIAQGHSEPFQVQVLDHGEIYLPRLGPIIIGGLSVGQAQLRVNSALAAGLLNKPNTVLTLTEKGTVNVLVLGAVEQPGVHALPRYENDVAHALAAAQGFAEDAGDVIEIHRRDQAMLAPVQINAGTQALSPTHVSPVAQFKPSVEMVPPIYPASAGRQYVVPQTNIQTSQHSSQAAWAQSSGLQNASGIPVGGVIAAPGRSSHSDHHNSTTQQRNTGDSGARYSSPFSAEHNRPSVSPANDAVIRGQSPIPVAGCGEFGAGICEASPIVRIPLRGDNSKINPGDVVLNPGDVLVIPRRTDKVFYVVGPLSEQNSIRFSVNNKDREIGGGLLLPDDREIDVVTAVAMAGYIDPIESPTTVTVHRIMPNGSPLLIRVDLLAARSDPQETVLVHAGDIIYLNPDAWWYGRRTMDRVIERALGTAVGRWLTN